MQTGSRRVPPELQRPAAYKDYDPKAATVHYGTDAGARRGRGYGNARNCRTVEISCRTKLTPMDGHFRLAFQTDEFHKNLRTELR